MGISKKVRQRLRGQRNNNGLYWVLVLFGAILPQAATGSELSAQDCGTGAVTPVLSAENTATGVKLTWTGALGADCDTWAVYKATGTASSINYEQDYLADATAKEYADNAVTVGSTYTYAVEAYKGTDNAGNLSNLVTITHAVPVTATAPPAPTLVATAGDAQVELSWTSGGDGGSAITEHEYRQKTTGGFGSWQDIPNSAADEANEASYTVTTGVTNGTTYTFEVRAVNAEGNGAASNQASATPASAETKPDAPTNLRLREKTGLLVGLIWDAPSGTVTRYKVYRETSSTGTPSNVRSDTVSRPLYTETVAEAGRYYYWVSAVNSAGEGALSDVLGPINVQELATCTGATAPTLVAPTATSGGVTLTWSGGNAGDCSFWEIYRADGTATIDLDPDDSIGCVEERKYADDGSDSENTQGKPNPGSTYTYQVRASDCEGGGPVGPLSNRVTVTLPGIENDETKVQNLRARGGRDRIDLSWDRPSGNQTLRQYRIQVKTTANGRFDDLKTIPATSTTYSHTDLGDGVSRWYRVGAVDSDNKLGTWSDEATATTTGKAATDAPSAPRNLTATSSTSGNSLSWTAPADSGSATITGYKVQYSTDGSTWSNLTTLGVTTSYLHRDPPSGTVRYRVFAINRHGDSPSSNVASVSSAQRIPSAPRNLTASARAGSISLSWDAPTSVGASEITGYRIETSEDGVGWETLTRVDGDARSYIHRNLTAGQQYFYRVFAVNAHGESSASNTADATVRAVVPSAPRNLTANASDNSIALSWDAPTDVGASAITGYRIETSEDGVGWETLTRVGGNTRSYRHLDLNPGQRYHYRVFAVNDHGESSASNVADANVKAVPPSAPTSLYARVSNTTVSLTWAAPANDGGAAVTGYRIEVTHPDGWRVLVDNTQSTFTSYHHTDVAPGSTLSYRVFAVNSAGRSQASNIATVTVEAVPPGPPVDIGATAQSSSRIGVAWSPPKFDGGKPVTGYRVEFSTDGSYWRILSPNFGDTFYIHMGLEAATRYFYRISAINEVGRGEPSALAEATTLADLPGRPRSLAAVARGAERIDLTWQVPKSDGGAPITGYQIEVSADGTIWRILAANAVPEEHYSHTDLTPNTTYYYRLSAINKIGVGGPSNVAHARTEAALPGRVRSLQASAKSHEEIVLTWLSPASDGGTPILGYRLEYSVDAGATWSVIRSNTGSQQTLYAHDGLKPATLYAYRVTALNRIGAGEPSDIAEAKTHAIAPSAPRDLIAKAVSSSQITLKWTEPKSDGGAPVTSYLIESSADEQEWTRLTDMDDAGTEYQHMDVAPGHTWYYRAFAINDVGMGPASNVASATTDDPIERTARANDAILPRFAAAVVSSTVRAVSARVDAASEGKADSRRVNLLGAREGDLRDLANGTSVSQTQGGLSIWGNADLTGLSDVSTVDWSGDVFSIHAGVDGMLREDVLVGLAGSRSQGAFDFTDRKNKRHIPGTYDATLTSMNPYVAWVMDEMSLWATTGFGWGSISIADSLVAERTSNISSSVIAAGGSKVIHQGSFATFGLRAEGWTSTVEVAGNAPAYMREGFEADHIGPVSYRMRRARLLLDWTVFTRADGQRKSEIVLRGGGRYDHNNVDKGIGGAEFGGTLKHATPTFRARGEGRIFVPPGSNYKEWGVSGMIELRSRDDNVALRVNPSYGHANSGIDQLWEHGAHFEEIGQARGRVVARLEFPALLAKPYSLVRLTGDLREYSTGISYRLMDGVDLKSEATRKHGETSLGLRGSWRH